MKRKPATIKARALLAKLEAMAERGINGERDAAQVKLDRLCKRYDFAAVATKQGDIFAGKFEASANARLVCSIQDPDLASSVKWAIEHATPIRCSFRNCAELWAEAGERTAPRLASIAETITQGFSALWEQYAKAGARPSDRGVFIMGLYDGMMNDQREPGTALPSRGAVTVARKAKRKAVNLAPGLKAHPYSTALELGRSIRFSTPLEEVSNQLAATITGALPEEAS